MQGPFPNSTRHAHHAAPLEEGKAALPASVESPVEPSQSPAAGLSRFVTPVFAFWAVLGGLLTIAVQFSFLNSPFVYTHGWVSAHFSVTARTFAELGFWHLRGVPITNNAPLGVHPEAYLHWPPLFSAVLSIFFRAFGSSEFVAHLCMLALLLINTALLSILVKKCLGGLAAFISVLILMTLPATVIYSHLVVNLHFMMAFVFLALLAFLEVQNGSRHSRRWQVIGCVAMILAVWSSWEALGLCPGLLVASKMRKKDAEMRLSLVYLVAGLGAALVLLGHFAMQYPQQVAETVQIVAFRLGLTHRYVVNFALNSTSSQPVPSLGMVLLVYGFRYLTLLSVVSLAAVAWWIFQMWRRPLFRNQAGAPMLAALCSMWWCWFTFFWFHVYIHDYQIFLAVPALAVATGWAGSELVAFLKNSRHRMSRPSLVWGLILLSPAFALRLPVQEIVKTLAARNGAPQDPSWFRQEQESLSGRDIGLALLANTPPNSVVLGPLESAVPIFYSKRHIVRGVSNDEAFQQILPTLAAAFPGSRFYLAIPADSRAKFPVAEHRFGIVQDKAELLLLDLQERISGAKEVSDSPRSENFSRGRSGN